MKAEIICLNNDNTQNYSPYKNFDAVTKKLASLDIELPFVSNIKPSADDIAEALLLADSRSSIIFILGACDYDTTAKDVLCELLHFPVHRNKIYAEHMQNQITKFGLPTDSFFDGSLYIPDGSIIFPDSNSIFCGFAVRTNTTVFVLLPNTTDLFLDEQIFAYLTDVLNVNVASHHLKAFDCKEEALENIFAKLSRRNPIKFDCYEEDGIVSIDITAYAASINDAETLCKNAVLKLKNELKTDIITGSKASLSEITVHSLNEHHLTISCAESCTGGMLTEALTDVSGASKVLEMGLCAYSNRIKSEVLNVPKQIIDTYGAVSKETACLMAKGMKELSGADISVSITGVAGPAASEFKPVGTVYLALYDGNHYWVRGLNLDSSLSRNTIRNISVNTALDLVRRYLCFYPQPMLGFCSYDNICVLKQQPKADLIENKVDKIEPSVNSSPTTANNLTNVETDFLGFSDEFENGFKIEIDDVDSESLFVEEPKSKKEFKKTYSKKSKKKLNFNINKRNKVHLLLLGIVSVILAAAVIMSGYFVVSQRDSNLVKRLNKIYSENDSTKAYNELKNINPDYAAWLSTNNSKISLPVCFSNDNEYYLEHNFKKKNSSDGTLFFDKKSSLDSDNFSKNLIIYGKNTKSGNMFSSLINYEKISYLNENNVFILDIGSEKLTYQIFAILVVNSNESDDNGHIFPFTKSNFSSDEEFSAWANELKTRSIISTSIELNPDDKFLTLSTNYNAFENSLFVVMAKQVETLEACDYEVNENPRYPQIWYDLKGLENPFKE